jgi:pimeloyl-ACP methyl ester carboxylesterase
MSEPNLTSNPSQNQGIHPAPVRYGVGVLPHDESGAGEDVVLIHAGIADRSMWAQHIDWFARAGFHVVAPDLPGFGEAPVSAGAQAPWEDVLGTLRDLGIERAALVGNSFGAAVALRVAAIAPSAVTKLVLISPPPLEREPSPELEAAWAAEESALERGDLDAAVEAVVQAWTQPDAPAALRAQVAAMQRRAFELQRDAAGTPGVHEAPDPVEQHPEVLRGLRIPTLAAAGERDMPDFAVAVGELAAVLPLCQTAVISGAGHLAPLETPEAFRDLLLAFLRDGG